ncbi:SA1362 family protein [Pseudoneobacillus sp. C159]
MGFLKNRTSFYLFISFIILALIGLGSRLIEDPAGFFKGMAIMILVGVVIFIVVKRFYQPGPTRNEQKAFLRAAKKTKKKIHRKKPEDNYKQLTKLTSLRRKSSAHLTVIEGKKNKKKNRASF